MLATLFAKSIHDRWFSMMIAASTLVIFLLYAMAVYRDIDLSIYTDMPDSIKELMGIPEGADAASLSYSVLLGFVGALTLAGMAVSIGSAAIAGEERSGTMGLLLANPTSRSKVLIAKTASMVALIGATTLVLWGAGRLVPTILGVEIGETHVGSMMLHMGLNAVFYGFMAMAIGASTGNRTISSAVTAGAMIISYFAVGLLPLIDSLSWIAELFPWYYFAGSDPLVNGTHWGHIALLAGGCGVFGVVALVGVNRRDLRGHSVGVTLLDRLRSHPATERWFDRLAGSTRVSRIWVKATSEHQGLLIVTSITMFGMMGLLMGPMYSAIEESIADMADDFPEAVLAIAGGGDLSTPEGFFQVETFSLMAPIAIMIVTIVIGARALAGEEANNTIGLLLANPVKRSTVVVQQALAMVVYAVVVGTATFAGVALASVISGLDMSTARIAATSTLVTLLGLVFGAFALALSAATGRVRVAVYGTIGAALVSHLLNSFLPLTDHYGGYARWTPNHYYLSSDPLVNGMHWGHAALLTALVVMLLAISVVAFDRRDLRQR